MDMRDILDAIVTAIVRFANCNDPAEGIDDNDTYGWIEQSITIAPNYGATILISLYSSYHDGEYLHCVRVESDSIAILRASGYDTMHIEPDCYHDVGYGLNIELNDDMNHQHGFIGLRFESIDEYEISDVERHTRNIYD